MAAELDSIARITNAKTFDNWKDSTNALIGIAEKTLTIGDVNGSASVNENVTLRLDLIMSTGKNITTDTIQTITAGNVLKIEDSAKIKGDLTLNNRSSSSTATKIQFAVGESSDTNTWFISTDATHNTLEIGKGVKKLVINDTTNKITASGLTLDSTILQSSLNGIAIGGITPAAGTFTDLVAVGTGSSSIDYVPIGQTSPSPGAFTGLTCSSLVVGNAENLFAGQFICTNIKGKIRAVNGDLVVDPDAGVASPNFIGNLTGNVTGDVNGNISGQLSAALKVEVIKLMYPIGSIFQSSTCANSPSNTSPAAGGLKPDGANDGDVGTWERHAQGRTQMGYHRAVDAGSSNLGAFYSESNGNYIDEVEGTVVLNMQVNVPVSAGERIDVCNAASTAATPVLYSWSWHTDPTATGTSLTVLSVTKTATNSVVVASLPAKNAAGATNVPISAVSMSLSDRNTLALDVVANALHLGATTFSRAGGGEGAVKLQNTQINHTHVTGSHESGQVVDWLPISPVMLFESTSEHDEVMFRNFNKTFNNIDDQGIVAMGVAGPLLRQINNSGNDRPAPGQGVYSLGGTDPNRFIGGTYTGYFGTTADVQNRFNHTDAGRNNTTVTTGLQPQMMDPHNTSVPIIPPHETVYMWIRTA